MAINIDSSKIIRQIKTDSSNVYTIDAPLWDGHRFSDIESMIHGVVDTYVIPAQESGTNDYKAVVESSAAQVSTTLSILNTLTSTSNTYKVGDIILMGATSDGKINFDRWVSSVSGDTITLDVLETQVATHHHTIGATTGSALTGMKTSTTTSPIPVVGTAVSVVTSVVGTFVTSVNLSDDGSHTLQLSHPSTSDSGSVSHSHTVNKHSHNITPTTLVSETIGAYTTLTSRNYTPHTHNTATVAGSHVDASSIKIVTGSNASDTFVKTLDYTSTNTGANTAGKSTSVNTSGLSTTAQLSTDAITSDIETLESGAHTHTVTTTTTENVVKTVNVATSVVTSVSFNFTAPGVQPNVVTSVTSVSKSVVTSATLTGTKTFMSTWSASVNTDGVLSFTTTSATVGISAPTTTISTIGTITSGTQSAGSASISAPRSAQSYTSGTVSTNGSAASNGAHTHGFGHTHVIPEHTHTIASHTHTYDRATVGTSAAAITSLSSTNYKPHTHENVTVAAVAVDGSQFRCVTGGTQTSVVRSLKDSTVATTDSNPGTNTVYTNITGDISFPTLTAPTGSINAPRESITPAAAGSEEAIKSITFTSSNFVTGLTPTGSIKTSKNYGGE